MHGVDFIQDLAVVLLVAGLVGWVCQRAGLSVIVGYLVAGMVIGPYTPPFSLVSDIGRIETLAQMGLVFLMFSIGMKLSLRKLRKLGWPLVVATTVTALLVYNLARVAAPWLGMGGSAAVFFGAMLIVSSSAIISKVLQETGLTHERAGQMAMGITVLEDVVAVVSLALLNSVVLISTVGDAKLGETLGGLGAFVVLAGVAGLLAVPWLLRKLTVTASDELQTLLVAGLMLGLAMLAQRAGYSLAMGAFILGSIVAETPQRGQVERVFEGARDMFSAVFFVAIGLQIDGRMLLHAWPLVLGSAVLALIARTLGATVGMLVSGVGLRDATRVGLLVTPLGEFSFIIVQLGVTAGIVPARFQAVAVGLSLATALAAPVLSRRSGGISEWVAARQPTWLADWLGYYREWLERMQRRQQGSVLWQVSRRRVIQITLEVLLVTGMLAFAEPLFEAVRPFLPGVSLRNVGPGLLYWAAFTLVTLLPLLAIWRNASALAMIYAELSTAGHPQGGRLRPYVEHGLRILAGIAMFFWLSAIVPVQEMGRWVPLLALLVAVAALLLLRSKLIYWHSVLEVELQERLAGGEVKAGATAAPFLANHGEWRLALTECVIPDQADCRGRTLGELGLRAAYGCVIAGIERQGVMIGNPPPDTALYPRDKLLLLGEPGPAAMAKGFLTTISQGTLVSNFDDVRLDTVTVPAMSRLLGRTLADLAPARQVGVQIAGIHRGGQRLLNPGGEETLRAGDDVLVLGSPEQIAGFRSWVGEE